jgi:hypothetical protein
MLDHLERPRQQAIGLFFSSLLFCSYSDFVNISALYACFNCC